MIYIKIICLRRPSIDKTERKITINIKQRPKNPFGYSFSSIRLTNWSLSLVQYKCPLEICVLQCRRTIMSVKLSKNVQHRCCSLYFNDRCAGSIRSVSSVTILIFKALVG